MFWNPIPCHPFTKLHSLIPCNLHGMYVICHILYVSPNSSQLALQSLYIVYILSLYCISYTGCPAKIALDWLVSLSLEVFKLIYDLLEGYRLYKYQVPHGNGASYNSYRSRGLLQPGYIDGIDDNGCWRRNVFATTLRCWCLCCRSRANVVIQVPLLKITKFPERNNLDLGNNVEMQLF